MLIEENIASKTVSSFLITWPISCEPKNSMHSNKQSMKYNKFYDMSKCVVKTRHHRSKEHENPYFGIFRLHWNNEKPMWIVPWSVCCYTAYVMGVSNPNSVCVFSIWPFPPVPLTRTNSFRHRSIKTYLGHPSGEKIVHLFSHS